MQADVLKCPAVAPLPHRHDVGRVEHVADQLLRGGVVKRSDADRICHAWHLEPLGNLQLAQVDPCFGVVQYAAAAEYEEVEVLNLASGLLTRQLAGVDRSFDVVALHRVFGVA